MEFDAEKRRRVFVPRLSGDLREILNSYHDHFSNWQSKAAQLRGLALSPHGTGRELAQIAEAEKLVAEVDAVVGEYRKWRLSLSVVDAQRVQLDNTERAMMQLHATLIRTLEALRRRSP